MINTMLILFATLQDLEEAEARLTKWGVFVSRLSEYPPILKLQDQTFPVDRLRGLPGVRNILPLSPSYPLVARGQRPDTLVHVNHVRIGEGITVMAGPCAVESRGQIDEVAHFLSEQGVHVLRGGAFKPRTSPYAFQGLGEEGLEMLRDAADRYGMVVISEVPDADAVPLVAQYADILQVGARNMQNFPLLRKLGSTQRPVLLKRGMGNTVEEWFLAAEYLLKEGNDQVILCERGIRTFEHTLRFTLDVGAVAYARHHTHLPVVVDPSHAAGQREFVIPLALAGIAAGAQGIIVEVHPYPEEALSDGPQALTFDDFERLMAALHTLESAYLTNIRTENTPDGSGS